LGWIGCLLCTGAFCLKGLRGRVVTVGGTNGKGSAVHSLEQLLRGEGCLTGAYTSPHIHRFNERIRVDGEAVDDDAICRAMAAVEEARGDTPLTYFEFTTLAAFWIFQQAGVAFPLLEVGLGGGLMPSMSSTRNWPSLPVSTSTIRNGLARTVTGLATRKPVS